MAKKIPVKICVIRHKPNKDPKDHNAEIFLGQASWIKELVIFPTGLCFIIWFFIELAII